MNEILYIFFVVTVISYIIHFRWKRRRLYELMNKIPGPAGLPLFGNAVELAANFQDVIKTIENWNKQYPSPFKVWLGPEPMIAITQPEDAQIVLSGIAGLSKAKMFATLFRSFLGDGLLASDEIKWKSRRKIIVSTFNPKILETFMPVFVKQNNILVECMRKEVERGPFEVWNYLSRVALDTICGTAMGVNTNSQISQCEYFEASKRILKLITIRMLRVWLHPDFTFHYLSSYGWEFRKCKRVMSTFTQNVIREKMKNLSERTNINQNYQDEIDHTCGKNPLKKAFLDYILELTQNDPNFTAEDIEEEVNTIMIAGYDTSSIANSFTMLALAMHQEVQQKVYDELYQIFGDSDRDIELDDLQHLQYMEMVIKESLRLYPTVYVFFRRLDSELKIKNYIIPKEVTCCIAVKLLHNNPNVWPDPMKFDPDRFLPEEISKRHAYSYIPFAAGPRNCIGYKYAMMSMKILLATVLRAYHLSTDIKEVVLDLTNTLQTTHGWMIKIKNRK